VNAAADLIIASIYWWYFNRQNQMPWKVPFG